MCVCVGGDKAEGVWVAPRKAGGEEPSIGYRLQWTSWKTVSRTPDPLPVPRVTGMESQLDKEFPMEGSHAPSSPRAQLPRWQCFRAAPNFRATRPKPKIFLKARVTFCPGPDRARVLIPLLPRRHQAPFSLRDLTQPWTLTVPESLLGPHTPAGDQGFRPHTPPPLREQPQL